MASEDAAQSGQANQSLVAALRRIYGKNPIQCDVFGRKMALPSEIAQALMRAKSNTTSPAQDEETQRARRAASQQSVGESERR